MYKTIIQRLKQTPTRVIVLTDLTLLLTLLFLSGFFNFQKNHPDSLVSEKKEAQRIEAACFGKTDWNCYKKEFSQLTNQKGLIFAVNTLYASEDINPFLRNCHIIAHSISQIATRKDPTKWKELMGQVNVYDCGGGFLHGILETHMADEPNFSITSEFINNLCSSFKEDERKRMCSHGLGHLILLEKEGNLDSSLPVCEGVHLDQTGMAMDCFIGLFMEDHQKLALSEHEISPLPTIDEKYINKLENACKKYQGIAGLACWNEMAEMYAKLYNYEPERVFEKCQQAPLPDQANRCYLKGVALMAVYYNFNTADKLLSICSPYLKDKSDSMYKVCLNYVTASLMYYSSKFIDRGIMFCTNVNTSYQDECFDYLIKGLKNNVPNPAQRQDICKDMPEKYKAGCIN